MENESKEDQKSASGGEAPEESLNVEARAPYNAVVNSKRNDDEDEEAVVESSAGEFNALHGVVGYKLNKDDRDEEGPVIWYDKVGGVCNAMKPNLNEDDYEDGQDAALGSSREVKVAIEQTKEEASTESPNENKVANVVENKQQGDDSHGLSYESNRREFVDVAVNEEAYYEELDQEEHKRVALHVVYGRTISFWQVVSVLVNTGMMLYAHLGVTAVFLSNQQLLQTSDTIDSSANNTGTANGTSCTIEDINLWVNGGAANDYNNTIYCGYTYKVGGCGLNEACNTECMHTYVGYTVNCASCWSKYNICIFHKACFVCLQSPSSSDCLMCTAGCDNEFYICTGLPVPANETANQTVASTTSSQNNNNTNGAAAATSVNSSGTTEDVCIVDTSAIHRYFVVYELSFIPAVKQAWISNAQILAVIIVLFSGVWPYVKNMILMVAWFLPVRHRTRNNILTVLRRLGKYTFIDIYVSYRLRESMLLFSHEMPKYHANCLTLI